MSVSVSSLYLRVPLRKFKRFFSFTNNAKVRSRVYVSGIQPSGVPHLGNYYGFIRQWVNLQNVCDSFVLYTTIINKRNREFLFMRAAFFQTWLCTTVRYTFFLLIPTLALLNFSIIYNLDIVKCSGAKRNDMANS